MSGNSEDLFSGLRDDIRALVQEEMKKKKKTPKKIYTANDETKEFVEFWETWRPNARQNDGRALARECFFKLVCSGADPRAIVDGTRYFFRTMKEKDREFVPLSATWLNRGAYEDLASHERAYQARLQNTNVVSMPAQSANYGRPEPVKPQEPASSNVDPERRRQLVELARQAVRTMQ